LLSGTHRKLVIAREIEEKNFRRNQKKTLKIEKKGKERTPKDARQCALKRKEMKTESVSKQSGTHANIVIARQIIEKIYGELSRKNFKMYKKKNKEQILTRTRHCVLTET